MKTFNFVLLFLGGILVSYVIFGNLLVSLPVYLYQLGRETTQNDVTNYFFIKNLLLAFGFATGWMVVKKTVIEN